MKIISFVVTHKKQMAFTGAALLVLAFAISLGSLNSKKQPNVTATPLPTSLPIPQGEWGKLDEITNKLGEPISGSASGNKNGAYTYKSSDGNKPNEVLYQNNVPVFYKEVVTSKDNKSAKSIISKFGQEEIVLYGELSGIGVNLYAYPSKGIAYLGSKSQGVLFEVWYFAPTDFNGFITTWAKDYKGAPSAGGY